MGTPANRLLIYGVCSAAGAMRVGRWPERDMVAPCQPREQMSVHLHVGMPPVAVGLAAPRRYELVVVGAREALGVPDDVSPVDVQPLHEPQGEMKGGGALGAIAKDLRVATGDVFDSDSGPVEANCVPAHHRERHELKDRAVAPDDEVDAGARQLAEMGALLAKVSHAEATDGPSV